MATSLSGALVTDRAFEAAPVPRPPQPISATCMRVVFAGMNLGHHRRRPGQWLRRRDRVVCKNRAVNGPVVYRYS